MKVIKMLTNKAIQMYCNLIYGIENCDDLFDVAEQIEKVLKIYIRPCDAPDMGGKYYEFRSQDEKIGELYRVVVRSNDQYASGDSEWEFKFCPIIISINLETINLLEIGRIAATIENDLIYKKHLISYNVSAEDREEGSLTLKRVFYPDSPAETLWNSHFSSYDPGKSMFRDLDE
jgi:hypothetical protein